VLGVEGGSTGRLMLVSFSVSVLRKPRCGRPVVGITPETITVDQVPRWERVAAMVLRVPDLRP